MRVVLFLLLLPTFAAAQDDSPLAVLEHQWFRDYKEAVPVSSTNEAPARAMIPENKKFRRDARAETSPRAEDPSDQTADGRSEALEKVVQSSRTREAKGTPGYTYRVKLHNLTGETVEVVFLEFQFTEIASPQNVVRRQFLCSAKIKPKDKSELEVFSSLGPTDVVTVDTLANENGKRFDSIVNINRIEYANGAILKRRDWDYKALKKNIERATSTPWGKEQCRLL